MDSYQSILLNQIFQMSLSERLNLIERILNENNAQSAASSQDYRPSVFQVNPFTQNGMVQPGIVYRSPYNHYSLSKLDNTNSKK